VVRCRQELDTIEIPAADVLKSLRLDIIKIYVLRKAVNHLSEYIKSRYGLENGIGNKKTNEIFFKITTLNNLGFSLDFISSIIVVSG